uniref:Uncharacterized protein n=1 Tax=Hyaloperonospora arabidopsidis (strain Emoy2) TaxID=559515 RepID=M4BMJ4_HYAAE
MMCHPSIFNRLKITMRISLTLKVATRVKNEFYNGLPPLHDNIHKVIIKYEYYVRINIMFSQYYPNR